MDSNLRVCRFLLLHPSISTTQRADVGALLWVTYGVLISASPVIVANVLVFSAAAWTTFRRSSLR